jgi:hypothetical protein
MKRFSVKRETEISGQNGVYTSPLKIMDEVLEGMLNDETVTITPLGEPEDSD